MSPLLRHLMPLIVIGSLFLFSLTFALIIVFGLGRLFRRPPAQEEGPLIEGTFTEMPGERSAPKSGG